VGLTWTFARGDERLILERALDEAHPHLMVTLPDGGHTLPFNDVDALVAFQTDIQRVLLSTGWLLANFAPDRRRHGDRPTLPRINNDGQRWNGRPHIPAVRSRPPDKEIDFVRAVSATHVKESPVEIVILMIIAGLLFLISWILRVSS